MFAVEPDPISFSATKTQSPGLTGCRICGHRGERVIYFPREVMFGTGEQFRYGHCEKCDCLQIETIPADLTRHYPNDYYSMSVGEEDAQLPLWFTLAMKARVWSEVRLRLRWNLLRRQMDWRLPKGYEALVDYLQHAGIRKLGVSILDVGCGANAYRLASLKQMGFSALLGVDPFIGEDLAFKGVAVLKRSIEQVDGAFDLIMFHHSLEHMVDPAAALSAAASRLRPGGVCLVRIPVMSSALWSRYGVDWVELDAPRHLHIMGHRTMHFLAKRAGMYIYDGYGDTTAWEFAASERNRDVRLAGCGASSVGSKAFGREDFLLYERDAAAVNEAGTSGRACFFLRHA